MRPTTLHEAVVEGLAKPCKLTGPSQFGEQARHIEESVRNMLADHIQTEALKNPAVAEPLLEIFQRVLVSK